MLFLVLPYRDEIGLVQKNVRSHQDRIGEKADTGTFSIALTFVLELSHSLKFAHPGVAGEHPGQFGVFRDVRLDENGRRIGVNTGSEINSGEIKRLLPETVRILGQRDRVKVDDAVKRLIIVLQRDPILECAEIVADMKVTRRLCPAENALFHKLKPGSQQ